MRGRITFINPATRTGIIFAPNQIRYRFRIEEWQGTGLPPRNAEVQFSIAGDFAVNVQPFSSEKTETEEASAYVPDILPVQPEKPAISAQPESDLSPEEAFEVGLPTQLLPIQEPVIKPAATPFMATTFVAPPATKIAFPVDAEIPSQPAWKLYLIGFGATVALVVVGLVVTHL